MKGKEKRALHTKTTEELTTLLKEKKKELVDVLMGLATNKIKNVHAARKIRREIAIMNTLKKVRQLAEEVTHG